ncbi:hypothetical protein D3C72_1691030 [compost metagenome]
MLCVTLFLAAESLICHNDGYSFLKILIPDFSSLLSTVAKALETEIFRCTVSLFLLFKVVWFLVIKLSVATYLFLRFPNSFWNCLRRMVSFNKVIKVLSFRKSITRFLMFSRFRFRSLIALFCSSNSCWIS